MPNAGAPKCSAPEEVTRVIVFLAAGESSAVNDAAVPVYGRS